MATPADHSMSMTGHATSCDPSSTRKKSISSIAATIDQTSSVNMASHLAALPGEILSNIVDRLGSDDVFSLRLTCRDLEAKSLHIFAMEYFSSKGFIFTTDSLKVLLHIAESERLRKYLRSVQFVTAYFPERQIECSNGCNCYGAPSIRQKEAYKDYMADQKLLKASGNDKKLLAKSFRLLHKLETIDIVDHFMLIPKGVDIRGLNKVQRVTGFPPTVPGDSTVDRRYQAWLSHVWKAVIVAMAQQAMPSLEEFRMLCKTAFNGLGVGDLGLSEKTVEAIRPNICNLKRLSLCLHGRGKSNALSQQNMVNFGGIFRNLDDLRLSFEYLKQSELSNLALLQDTDLCKLSRLHIDGLHTTSVSLCSLLARMDSAVEIFFMWINIKDGTWVEVLETLQKMSKLEHLHLQWLGQGARKAYFLKQSDVPFESGDEWTDRVRQPGPATMQAGQSTTAGDDADHARIGEAALGQTSEWEDEDDFGSSEDDNDDVATEGERTVMHEEGELLELGYDETDPDVDVDLEDGHFDDPSAERGGDAMTGDAYPRQTEQHFQAPGHEAYNERGYYVCLHQSDIAKYLPIFIDEYNLGQDFAETGTNAAGFFGGAMPPLPRAAVQAQNPAAGGHPHTTAVQDLMFNDLAQILGALPDPFLVGPGGIRRPGRD